METIPDRIFEVFKQLFTDESIRMMLKLGFAAFLGGIIGFERELHGKAAGVRTHIIVASASCLVMLVSIFLYRHVCGFSDPSRIAANIVTGIGFLGAGAIFRYGISVKGLTTAAGIWGASGIGLAVGTGFYSGAIYATFVIIIANSVIDAIEHLFYFGRSTKQIAVGARDMKALASFEQVMKRDEIHVIAAAISKDTATGKVSATYTAACHESLAVKDLIEEACKQDGIEKISVE